MGIVIGLCGNAGAGKDTVADHLVANHRFVKVSLADPLKRICRDVFRFSDEQLWGPSEMRNAPDSNWSRPSGEPLTPRYALQRLGTEWGRDCSPDVWVRYAFGIAEDLFKGGRVYTQMGGVQATATYAPTGIVIPDVRFLNEVNAVRSMGGQVWRIKRSSGPQLEGMAGLHASETELQDIDPELFGATIHNDFSKAVLYSSVDEVLERAFSK
jgi:hypothetical protein